MAEKLKIIPLGGLNEIGKNMTAYEYGGEIIVVDCGMAFPGDDMYGIDLIIPDVSYLIKNRARIRGLFITHGHEDHVGAIPYVLKQLNMPIYCTRFTAGLIKLKLEEHGLVKSTKLITVEPGKSVRAGKFTVEFIHVNHSIADSVAFAIHTHMGTVVQTSEETDRMMANTDPRYVFLCYDTGHFTFAGEDPLAMLKKYVDRVGHVHLKDMRLPVVEEARKNDWSFLQAVRNGAFTVPGDGDVDFDPVFRVLADAGYQGWLLVEAEQDPAKANPLEYAMKARKYIREHTGL